jgi:hypothetical protein
MRRRSKLVEKGAVDGLASLRSVFVSFVITGVAVGVVVAILAATNDSADAGGLAPAVLVVGALGVVALAAVGVAARRPLDCTSDESLASTYTSRFFLQIAIAESVAMAGFVAFLVTDQPVVYPLGVVFAAFGFAWLAPTARHLARDQQRLQLAGCGRSVVAALRARRNGATS